jgi:hypothetical protein
MAKTILRFQSLALRDEGQRSTVHFELEDEDTIVHCRARVDERADGSVDVGDIEGYRGAVDRATFRCVVEALFRAQLESVRRLADLAEPIAGWVVALGAREVVMDARQPS